MQKWLIAPLLVLTGCATVPVRQAGAPSLAEADAQVLAGCYTCLLSARDAYAKVAATRSRSAVVLRLFETEVLLGMRQAELALSPEVPFARAAALLPELPASSDASFLLDLARAIPPERQGTPRSTMRQSAKTREAFASAHFGTVFGRLDRSITGLPFRNYLSASLACLGPTVGVRPATVVEIPADSPPLVLYRLATCPNTQTELIERVVAEVPAFVEAEYLRARVPAVNVTVAYVATQRQAYAAAGEVFPASPSILYSVAGLHQTLGDCRAAVDGYDALLAIAPDHEDGSLQRIICLGYLARHDDAIAAATRLIDERFDNMGEAYYWRAWNHHKALRLVPARADIDRAMSSHVDSAVLSLSGIIKYEQKEYPPARRDLQAAIGMDPLQCIARWYLGLVAFESEDWPGTGQQFEASATCYRESAERSERDLEAMRGADLDPTFKASQIAGFEAVIAEDRGQEQASYLNAANGYIRAAFADKARVMLVRITTTSPHAAAARELSGYLDAIVGPESARTGP